MRTECSSCLSFRRKPGFLSLPLAPSFYDEGSKREMVKKLMRTGVSMEENKRVLSVREAAPLLGLTERACWLQIYRGRVPYRRLGRKVIILRGEIDKFLGNSVAFSRQRR